MDTELSRKHTRRNAIESNRSAKPSTSFAAFAQVQAATRDSDYWFDSGNLILVSQGVAFRIYKCLLAEHSAVFRSMFAQSTPAPGDLVDGCPVIILDDFPKDWRELFGLLYPRSPNFKLSGRKVDMALISAIIRLGYKYEIKGLYDQAMGYLTSYYTTSFDAWTDGRNTAQWQPDPIHAIRAINLARLTNTTSILPLAFYICATLGSDIADGLPLEDGSTEWLTPKDMRLVLEMKTHLGVENAHTAFLLFRSPSERVCCSEVWRKLLEPAGLAKLPHRLVSERALDSWVENADGLRAVFAATRGPGVTLMYACGMGWYYDSQLTLCEGCRNHLQARDRELRRQVWHKLPQFLGLAIEGWDDWHAGSTSICSPLVQ